MDQRQENEGKQPGRRDDVRMDLLRFTALNQSAGAKPIAQTSATMVINTPYRRSGDQPYCEMRSHSAHPARTGYAGTIATARRIILAAGHSKAVFDAVDATLSSPGITAAALRWSASPRRIFWLKWIQSRQRQRANKEQRQRRHQGKQTGGDEGQQILQGKD